VQLLAHHSPNMICPVKPRLMLVLLLPILVTNVAAQVDEFLPEIDLYYKMAPNIRADFQAKATREGGAPTQTEIGPSIEFYLNQLRILGKANRYDPDEAKSRPVAFSIGYRYLPSPNAPAVNRIEPVVTIHLPATHGFLLSDRSRADLDWQSGTFFWRYRNLFQIERRLTIGSYHPAPYAAIEPFYQSMYGKWSDTAMYAGCLLPVIEHMEFDAYYEHQNNTGKHPNQTRNQLGLKLGFHF